MSGPLVAHRVNSRFDTALGAAQLQRAHGLNNRGASSDEDSLGQQAPPYGTDANRANTGLLVEADER